MPMLGVNDVKYKRKIVISLELVIFLKLELL